jgi:hypothetical protein
MADKEAMPPAPALAAAGSGSGDGDEGTAHFSWVLVLRPAIRCQKVWTQSRRLQYTTLNREVNMENPAK